MDSIEAIDEIYNNLTVKIEHANKNYPKLLRLWSRYFEKHTLLYKTVLKDLSQFINNVNDLPCDLNENNILMLYLISNYNNDININN